MIGALPDLIGDNYGQRDYLKRLHALISHEVPELPGEKSLIVAVVIGAVAEGDTEFFNEPIAEFYFNALMMQKEHVNCLCDAAQDRLNFGLFAKG